VKPTGASEIVQLRQILSERFPHLKAWSEEAASKTGSTWSTGIAPLDQLLQGGLPKGALTEIVSARPGGGSALLLGTLLREARRKAQPVGLIDGLNTFDVSTLDQAILSQLLWVRCKSAEEAMKSADILLRDRNLPFVILDLKMNAPAQLRKISATAWYRLQRILQQSSTVLVVLSPFPLAGSAEVRLSLESQLTLAALERDETEVSADLKFELTRSSLAGPHAETAAEAG
jgi:hypothetical protein